MGENVGKQGLTPWGVDRAATCGRVGGVSGSVQNLDSAIPIPDKSPRTTGARVHVLAMTVSTAVLSDPGRDASSGGLSRYTPTRDRATPSSEESAGITLHGKTVVIPGMAKMSLS